MKTKIFSERNLVKAFNTPPLEKTTNEKQGEIPLPILSLTPSIKCRILEWDGTEDG